MLQAEVTTSQLGWHPDTANLKFYLKKWGGGGTRGETRPKPSKKKQKRKRNRQKHKQQKTSRLRISKPR